GGASAATVQTRAASAHADYGNVRRPRLPLSALLPHAPTGVADRVFTSRNSSTASARKTRVRPNSTLAISPTRASADNFRGVMRKCVASSFTVYSCGSVPWTSISGSDIPGMCAANPSTNFAPEALTNRAQVVGTETHRVSYPTFETLT